MAKPDWLAITPHSTKKYDSVKQTISSLGLHTICVEGHCPNINECWDSGTATFMVLGDRCTRGCRFCAVTKSAIGRAPDPEEPKNLAMAIKEWNLDYAVVTSVCRDDLPDQGSGHFARCINEVRSQSPNTVIEVLIPDFKNDYACLKRVVDAKPDVVGHNLETVERLSAYARDRRADYRQSIAVLKTVKEIDGTRYTKSALMLGAGETEEEVLSTFGDLRDADVDFLAIGQYLRPTPHHMEVKEYVHPDRFSYLKGKALEMGFLYVAAGPFVRSSYKAGEFFVRSMVQK
ncbi:MAG: lipoyl synthase [Candidatus Micrarchaeota archaeon]|nr:lipoyl synthase [Candidatus Micrarchaeota archaeon]